MLRLHHLWHIWKVRPLHSQSTFAYFRPISYENAIIDSWAKSCFQANILNKWQKYPACKTCSISCTFLLISPKAAARTLSMETNPENFINPASHKGETHFEIFLGKKPSWTQSRARNETKDYLYNQQHEKITTTTMLADLQWS